MMRVLIVVVALLWLAGCAMTYRQVSQMTPAQVAQLSDRQMCEANNRYDLLYNSLLWDPGPMNPAFAEERDRRGLSCAGDVAVGRGTAGIMAQAEIEARARAQSDAASDALIGLGLGLMATQPLRPVAPAAPRAIDCSVTGNSRYMSCR
jgi:hypothetical protein